MFVDIVRHANIVHNEIVANIVHDKNAGTTDHYGDVQYG